MMRSCRSRQKVGAAWLAISALGLGASAHAQTPPGDTGGAAQLDEIIVTAQHRTENIQDGPITIQTLSGSVLENLGVQNTVDIGNVTSNLTITLPQGQGNQPQVTIRGIGLNENNSNDSGPNGFYVDDFYEVPIGAEKAISFEYSGVYKSFEYFDSTNDPYITQPGYWLQNARVALKLDKLEISAYVRNVANKYYRVDAFDSIEPFGFVQPNWGPPRTYGGEVPYRF